MIEINLLPDVKQEFIRAQKLRNVVISISVVSAVVAGGLLLVLGLFLGAQAVRDNLADRSIDEQYKKLSDVSDISKIVTIQNRMSAISSLNENRLVSSRLLDTLVAINPTAPNDVKMSSVKYDPVAKTVTIGGTAVNSYTATDIFKKTILNTKLEYTLDGQKTTVPLTNSVNITETTFSEASNGQKVLRFSLVFTYDENLFSNKVTSAQIISPTGRTDVTDSKTGVPNSLFTTTKSTTGGAQ